MSHTIIRQWQNATVQMALTSCLWESCDGDDWTFWLIFGDQMSRTSSCCNNCQKQIIINYIKTDVTFSKLWKNQLISS